jgi:hypothetical protein
MSSSGQARFVQSGQAWLGAFCLGEASHGTSRLGSTKDGVVNEAAGDNVCRLIYAAPH